MSLHHMLRAAAGNTAGSSDPYFEYNTLLLSGDGTNGAQNNTFLDSSTNNFTITRNGNTTQGTFSPYGTLWSNYFDGSGDYLTTSSSSNLALGSGDFTLETWYCPTSKATTYPVVIQNRDFTTNAWQIADRNGALTVFSFFAYNINTGSPILSSSTTVVNGTWYHLAVTRQGNTFRLFVNGVLEATTTSSASIDSGTSEIVYVGGPGATTYVNGYISNVRIVKGTALYTSNFTPSTTPLTAVSGTSLLTCQSNRFIDNSSNNFSIFRDGNTSIQRFSPFNPAAAYSTSTIGGSGYFDGNGDYLSVASTSQFSLTSTTDFTVECWVYFTSLPSQYGFILVMGDGTNYMNFRTADAGFSYRIQADFGPGTLSTLYDNNSYTSGYLLNKWTHLAFSRSGSTTSFFIDGVRIATKSGANYSFGNTSWTLGALVGYSYDTPGYISDFRFVKGTAVYDATQSTLTVPTAPLTAVSGTQLLTKMTNAGIPDAAMMNDLETVGNAQVSTSVKKYGTGSLYFDGTGDWLTAVDTPNLQFRTGNFTIEGWVYLAATGSARGIIGKGTSTTGWLLSTNSSNKVVFTYGSSTITSTGSLSGTTWYHIAVVREGTGTNQTKIYINGSNDGTGTVSTDFNQTNLMYVGADRTATSPMNGYIDDLRITKGYARYTTNFTPPTAALPIY